MSDISIRPAVEADCALILHLIRALAIYEKALHEVQATEQDLHLALFGESARSEAMICEIGGEPVGFALYFFSFSTWLGKYGLFLEDLFVAPEHRGAGAGKALLQHLAKVAVARDCGRFEWNVLDWNEPAIRFYQSVGAKAQDEWIGYRLEGQALQDFATS